MRLLAIAAVLVLCVSTSAAEEVRWLPVGRPELLEIARTHLGSNEVRFESLDALSAKLRALANFGRTDGQTVDGPTRADIGLSFEPNAEVWDLSQDVVPMMFAVAGDGERVHSFRLVLPVANYSERQGQQVAGFVSALFGAIQWPEADWWKRNLKAAWDKSPVVTHQTPADLNETAVKESVAGVRAFAFGVPPDLVVYVVTGHPRCTVDLNRPDVLDRLVC